MGRYVPVRGPDGSRLELPEENLEKALARGYTLDDDEASHPSSEPMAQPAPQVRSAPVSEGYVAVVSPDGRELEVPQAKLADAQAKGYRAASELADEQRAAELQAEYGGLGGQVATAAEKAIGGLTGHFSNAAASGLSGKVLGSQLDEEGYVPTRLTPEARARMQDPAIAARMAELGVNPEDVPRDQTNFGAGYAAADQERANRAAANPVTAAIAEGVGMVGGVLATGGIAPSALASRGAVRAAEFATAKLGTGAIGRVAATALGGAVEGGTVAAVQHIADNVPEFTVDPMEAAEHALYAAGEGALLGGAIGGGLGLAGEAVRGVGRAGAYAAEKMGAKLGDYAPTGENLERMAGENAYKAVVGRTNKAAFGPKLDRQGGAAAVGKTLLKEGIPVAGPAEEIFAATSQRADEVGAQLGAKVKEIDAMGGIPISGREIMGRIDQEVMHDLHQNVFGQDIAQAVEAKLATFRGIMETDAPLSFDNVRKMRIDLDQTLAKWGQAGPPTPAVQALRDVRSTLENSWLEAADRSAESVGRAGFAAEVKGLKQTYGHLRLAADEAEKAVQTRAANRNFSLTDNLQGIGASSALGGGVPGMLGGLAVGVGHKYVRERGRGLAALALHQFAGMAEQKGALVAMASSGQARVARAAQSLVQGVQQAKYALPGAAVAGTFGEHDIAGAIAEAKELQNPNSPAQQHLTQNAQRMDMLNPGMGVAYANAAHARAKLITDKLPKPSTVGVFAPQPVLDPITDRRLKRTVTAAMDPQRALERIAQGTHSPEDIEAIRTVYPQTYKRFQAQVVQQLKGMRTRPNYETRVRISTVIGQAADPSMEIAALRLQQEYAQGPDQGKLEEAKADASNKQEAASMGDPYGAADKKPKFRDADQVYAAPVASTLDRR